MGVRKYRTYPVWQEGIDLADTIYSITKEFPIQEQYGLISQMRRCSVSVPSNIAEGSQRSTKEFARFLGIAKGSAAELETQLIISEKAGYLASEKAAELIDQVNSLCYQMHALQKKLKADARASAMAKRKKFRRVWVFKWLPLRRVDLG